MKKIILILAIILTSGVAAWCVTAKTNTSASNTVAQVKAETSNISSVATPNATKSDISSAD
jgi:outer membrane lipoprotein-sorting protein